MTLFWIIWPTVIAQRVAEVMYARRNEAWLREKGAVEYGQSHYKFLVLMHAGFFVVFLAEWLAGPGMLHPLWPLLLTLFLIVQIFRGWMFRSLGRFWNTKILVVPGEKLVADGIYSGKIRHPNYVIVSLELLLLPLIFQAYVTAAVFTVLNAGLLWFVRIPAEEAALRSLQLANTDN